MSALWTKCARRPPEQVSNVAEEFGLNCSAQMEWQLRRKPTAGTASQIAASFDFDFDFDLVFVSLKVWNR